MNIITNRSIQTSLLTRFVGITFSFAMGAMILLSPFASAYADTGYTTADDLPSYSDYTSDSPSYSDYTSDAPDYTDYTSDSSYSDYTSSPSYTDYTSDVPSYTDYTSDYSPSYSDYTSDAPSYADYTSDSPSYADYTSDSPSYTDYTSDSPSYESYSSYEAPSVAYASYTSGASYSAPVYTSASYQQPVVYQQPPVVYQQPPVVVQQPPVVIVQNNLTATCYAQNTNSYENQNITWIVNASGGNGGYTYTWGGVNLNGQHGSSVTTSYNSPGNETATVSVYSNGQTINVNCGSIYVNPIVIQTNSLQATCYANVASAVVGSTVTWTAIVSGGNGNYTYSWVDNNGVNTQTSSGPTFTTSYPIAGTKSPTLHVSSLGSYGYGYNGNGSITVTCRPIGINSGYNAAYTTTYINPTPTGSLASLSSVSLNQVPYTGLTDSAGFWEFVVGLFLASLAGTWYFMKVYARGKRRYMINLFKKDNLAKKMAA